MKTIIETRFIELMTASLKPILVSYEIRTNALKIKKSLIDWYSNNDGDIKTFFDGIKPYVSGNSQSKWEVIKN